MRKTFGLGKYDLHGFARLPAQADMAGWDWQAPLRLHPVTTRLAEGKLNVKRKLFIVYH